MGKRTKNDRKLLYISESCSFNLHFASIISPFLSHSFIFLSSFAFQNHTDARNSNIEIFKHLERGYMYVYLNIEVEFVYKSFIFKLFLLHLFYFIVVFFCCFCKGKLFEMNSSLLCLKGWPFCAPFFCIVSKIEQHKILDVYSDSKPKNYFGTVWLPWYDFIFIINFASSSNSKHIAVSKSSSHFFLFCHLATLGNNFHGTYTATLLNLTMKISCLHCVPFTFYTHLNSSLRLFFVTLWRWGSYF